MFLMQTRKWNISRLTLLIAGSFVLLTVLLGYLLNPYIFAFTGFIGLMMIVSSITGFCPMAIFLHKLGIKCDIKEED